MTFKPFDRRKFLAGSAAMSAVGMMPLSPAFAQTVNGLFDDIPLEDTVMGDINAKVTILEYASMTCPHCKSFHEKIMPDLKAKYIETGKAKYILRPFPFDGDRRGEAAFMLAKCAGDDKYYAMVDELFRTQNVWAGGGNPVPELLRIAKFAGMSEDEFKACLSNQDLLTKMVEGRNKAVKDFGVKATPTIFVNDEKLGDSQLETVSKAIEAAL